MTPRKTQKRARKPKPVKMTKQERACDRLYSAALHYIEAHGGTAIVAGGTTIMRWPDDPEHKYALCIQIMGRAPKPPVLKP
jgi:hypothetical protein